MYDDHMIAKSSMHLTERLRDTRTYTSRLDTWPEAVGQH